MLVSDEMVWDVECYAFTYSLTANRIFGFIIYMRKILAK